MKRIAIVIGAVALGVVAYLTCRGSSTPAPIAEQPPLSRARIKLRDLAHRPPASISGTVTFSAEPGAAAPAGGGPAPAGARVEGAIVCVRPITGDDGDITCVTSNVNGAYRFASVPPDRYALWASANGASARWDAGGGKGDGLQLAAGESRSGIDLVLVAEGELIAGRAHDTRGHAITGALIHVTPVGREIPEQTVKTDARGEFIAHAAASKVWVVATAEGFGDAQTTSVVPGRIDILMIAEGVVSGVVIAADTHAPVADAKVSIGSDSTITDDAGTFRIRKLAPGRYKPAARAIGRYGEAAESVLVRIGGSVEGIVIETHAVAVVAGKINVVGGGTCPEGKGGVQLMRRGAVDYSFGSTTGDGDVLIEGVVAGTYKVEVSCGDYLRVPPYPDLTVGSSDVEDVVWNVARGAKVTGRVTEKGGGPLADVVVMAHGGDGRDGGGTRTAADGTYEIGGLPPGPATVRIRQPGYREVEDLSFTADLATPAKVDIALDKVSGSIEGEVVDALGLPVPDISVLALEPQTGTSSEPTDARGKFSIQGVAPGTYVVTTKQRWSEPTTDKPPVIDGVHAVKVTVGSAPVRVHLTANSFASTITGTVVDSAGKPVPDVAIDVAETPPEGNDEAHRRSWEPRVAYSGDDGTFRIGELPDKVFDVRARIEGASEVVAAAVSPGARIRLVLPSTGTISGVVTDPSGAAVDDVDIELGDRAQDLSRSERLFHTGGKFTFRDVQAGSYRITVDSDRQTSVMVELGAGETRTDVRIAVRPRHALRGRLLAADRTPLAGWQIEVPHKEEPETTNGRTVITYEVEKTITDARGEFLVEGLVGKEVTVSAGDVVRHPDRSMTELRTISLAGASPVDAGDLVMPAKP